MKASRPPAWARKIAGWLVKGPEREFVLGDLDEMYERRGRTGVVATFVYLTWVARSAMPTTRSPLLSGIALDIRVALRQFRRRTRVYLGGSLVLAVGLGISTLTWGVRYGSVGRDLPVSDPERVLWLSLTDTRTRARLGLSMADAAAVREHVSGIDAVALWSSASANLTDGAAPPSEVSAYLVSADLFRILEIVPLHGRLLTPDDERPGASPVAVLGHRHWLDRYGGDVDVLGRSIRLDGDAVEIVGVLPEGRGLTAFEDVWLPVNADDGRKVRASNALVRLSAGTDTVGVNRALEAMAAGLAESGRPEWSGRTLTVLDFHDGFYGPVDSVRDRVLGLGGILLLVMALANVANLFLVVTRERAHELSIRRALGSGRARVLRQLVLEAAGPALLGFVGAATIAAWTLALYQEAADAYGVGFVWQVYRLEAPHLILLALSSMLSTVLVSVVAAARELGGEGPLGLRTARGGIAGAFRMGRALLGVEIAVGAALFLVAALMIRSGWNLRTVDFDFTTASVMTGDLTLRGDRYQDASDRRRFWEELGSQLERVEGVQAVGMGAQLPLIRCCDNRFGIEVRGWEVEDPSALPIHYGNGVAPGYFEVFEAPLLAGRAFGSGDGTDGERVAIVNTHFAERYFPDRSPMGESIRLWRGDEPGPWRRVIGVAPHLWMDTDVNATPEGVYVPLAQMAPRRASFAVRVPGTPEAYADALRTAVATLDPELPVNDLRSMPQLFRDRTSLYRRESPLFTFLGLAALVLAVAGLYAVVSYMASLRSAEFGLRSALGAGRAELIRRSVRGALLPTGLGVVAGLGVGLALTRGFDRFVFLVDPWSPWVVAATIGILGASAIAASAVPALRASRVDPASVLASE